MIDFPNLPNTSPVARTGPGWNYTVGKKEPNETGACPATAAADVVQISADAALKGKLSAFATTLAREMEAADAGRIARLKEAYAGDRCPVSSFELAGAILVRMKADGSGQ